MSAEFDYDSAQHLVYRYSNDRHVTLGYDVNDALVREAEMGAAAVAKRLSFGGWHQHTDDQGVTVTYEEVLPNLTLSDGVPYLVAREPSGASLSVVALTDGTEASTVRAGVYGQDEGSPSWWELDKLHGGVRSLDDQLVHRGARHHLASDGRWLQPEPLLYLGLTNGDLAEPLGYGPVYARGNSNEWEDRSGRSPLALATVLTAATTPEGQSYGVGDIAATYGMLAATVGNPAPGPEDAVLGMLGWAAKGAGRLSGPLGRGLTWIGKSLGLGRGACFVQGTEVTTASGEVPIEEVEPGDVVLAAASTGGGEEAWVKVESDADAKSAAWSTRGRRSGGVCSRLAKAGRKAVLPAMLAACDPASATVELPSDVAVVRVYDARTGAWDKGLVGELEVGDEVLHEGHLLRVTEEGVEDRGFAEVGQLSEADATWTVDGVARVPDGDDWVLVLGEGTDAGHWRLQELMVGERFAFGGRVFESSVVDGELAVRATEQVLSLVVQTFERQSDTVIDAEIAYEDGTVEVITGTPEHPFWVPKLHEWVPLGELVDGTELHVDSGAGAILVSSTWRQGDFTVYNFEVEGTHNYFVRAPDSDAPAVLVHNNPLCFLTRSQNRAFGTIDNILANHAKPHDFAGVAKELAGERIPNGRGGFFNHIQEMKDSVAGLRKQIRSLNGSLENPNLSDQARTAIQDKIAAASAMETRMTNALGGTP